MRSKNLSALSKTPHDIRAEDLTKVRGLLIHSASNQARGSLARTLPDTTEAPHAHPFLTLTRTNETRLRCAEQLLPAIVHSGIELLFVRHGGTMMDYFLGNDMEGVAKDKCLGLFSWFRVLYNVGSTFLAVSLKEQRLHPDGLLWEDNRCPHYYREHPIFSVQ